MIIQIISPSKTSHYVAGTEICYQRNRTSISVFLIKVKYKVSKKPVASCLFKLLHNCIKHAVLCILHLIQHSLFIIGVGLMIWTLTYYASWNIVQHLFSALLCARGCQLADHLDLNAQERNAKKKKKRHETKLAVVQKIQLF